MWHFFPAGPDITGSPAWRRGYHIVILQSKQYRGRGKPGAIGVGYGKGCEWELAGK